MRRLIQLICLCTLAITGSCTAAPSNTDSKNDEDEESFLVVGDVGLAGDRQSSVAKGMTLWSTVVNAQFTLNLGDNFYERGVSSKNDPLWDTYWRNVFNSPSLNHTWYSIAGNHDYMQNPLAQVDYYHDDTKDSRWYMPSLYYNFTRRLPQTGTTIDFFMMYVICEYLWLFPH